jgi:malonyl-CoA O-methyltransferase
MFSTLGPDTLKELREAWTAADDAQHVNHFVDMHNVGDAVMQAGLCEPVLDLERTQLTYPDVLSLMRDLKAIGAHNVAAARTRGLTPRAKLQRMEQAYEKARSNDRLPATYEVIYGTAWGGGSPAARSSGGEVLISPTEIRKRG